MWKDVRVFVVVVVAVMVGLVLIAAPPFPRYQLQELPGLMSLRLDRWTGRLTLIKVLRDEKGAFYAVSEHVSEPPLTR